MKRKEFVPKGGKFFSFVEDPFQEEQKNKQIAKVVSLGKSLLIVYLVNYLSRISTQKGMHACI